MTEKSLKITDILQNPYQPRTYFDPAGIEEMASSIKKYGVLQPLLVRETQAGEYELIAGQRRIEGSKLAGLEEVPVIVKTASDAEMLEMAIIENIHREDMSPIDKAMSFKQLMTRFNMTQNQISSLLGISRPAIANTIRLLDLPENVKDALHNKQITEGHARALLNISDKEKRDIALKRIVAGNMSVRDAEEFAKILKKQGDRSSASNGENYSPDEQFFVDLMRERLGTKVTIKRNGDGGKIEIEFYSDEQLKGILDII